MRTYHETSHIVTSFPALPHQIRWSVSPVTEIERRERLRGNRQIGEGLYHLKTHTFCKYDAEVDTMQPLERNVDAILTAWRGRFISEFD